MSKMWCHSNHRPKTIKLKLLFCVSRAAVCPLEVGGIAWQSITCPQSQVCCLIRIEHLGPDHVSSYDVLWWTLVGSDCALVSLSFSLGMLQALLCVLIELTCGWIGSKLWWRDCIWLMLSLDWNLASVLLFCELNWSSKLGTKYQKLIWNAQGSW